MSKNAKRQAAVILQEAQEKRKSEAARPKPHPVLSVEQRLRSMITGLLGGPGGDPDMHHRLAAAHAVILLADMGLSVKESLIDELKNNLYETDFLELAKQNAHL